jgi:hypothetical protein
MALFVTTANELYQAILEGEPHIVITEHITFSGFQYSTDSLEDGVEALVQQGDQLPMQVLATTKTIRVRTQYK